MHVREPSGLLDLTRTDLSRLISVHDVVVHGTTEEHRLLRDDSDAAAQELDVRVLGVVSVDELCE